ncbi:MAG: 16S rRNA (uracil(1498)-N(3))-methyltransferase [Saprospiraceae bacterium]|nr:16S rRNA (uracil(1498)-N(3))-methyltransferase [Saprospiraceae bacterium]
MFFSPDIRNGLAKLDEEESRHLLTVLRRQVGDRIWLTDGMGIFYETEIVETGKKHAQVRVIAQHPDPVPVHPGLHLAIAPTKNADRLEWLCEKATELGIREITPLLCQRSERTHLRTDRLQKILVSAMKQSLRAHLPVLHEPTRFSTFIQKVNSPQRFIPWCADDPLPHLSQSMQPNQDATILIGPEGDFSPEEVATALQNGFKQVSLGPTRLRTETAGLLAVVAFNLANASSIPPGKLD